MEKKIDILYFGDVRDVNGVNLVTNTFLLGKEIFRDNGLSLQKIYSSNGVLDCSVHKSLPIGINLSTKKYKVTRIVRTILKRILDSRIPLFAWIKLTKNVIQPAERVISSNAKDFIGDYVIFQDYFTAYFYYKDRNVKPGKTLLVLHSGEDMFGQLKILYPGIFNSRYKERLEAIAEFALSKVDKIVYVSKKSARENSSTKGNVHFIHNGLPDLKEFAFRNDVTPFNFVCIGSMNYNKGQDVIIEAVNLISEEAKALAKFYLIGDGPQMPELKRSVNKYNLEKSIEFLGLRKDVPDLLRDMDVLMLPSKTEGLPLSIIEGLRQGLFIIATDVGGISEMITEEFGLLIERDKLQLKGIIEDIVLNKKVNQVVREASRLHYEQNFTLKAMIDKYSAILTSIQ